MPDIWAGFCAGFGLGGTLVVFLFVPLLVRLGRRSQAKLPPPAPASPKVAELSVIVKADTTDAEAALQRLRRELVLTSSTLDRSGLRDAVGLNVDIKTPFPHPDL